MPSAGSVDKAKVGELMGKLAANPQDPSVLWDLGNTYFTGGDFAGALKFYQMLVEVTPKDDSAWIAVGAASFNLADDATAKKAWEKAAQLNPKNAESHYNLGFWYLAQNPAQEAKAKAEWQKVIDIDPKSEMATNVKQHLDSLATASPKPTK
jgi:Flp pilus assembly protein TadD